MQINKTKIKVMVTTEEVREQEEEILNIYKFLIPEGNGN